MENIPMVISTTENIPGKEIVETLGIARGSTVRAKNIGKDIFADINIVGQYTACVVNMSFPIK